MSWLLSLSGAGRGVSVQPLAEPARSQSSCLSRGQALADGTGGTKDALIGARIPRLQWGFGKEPGRTGPGGPRGADFKEGRPPQRGGSSKPLAFPGLSGRGSGQQMPLQVSCHPGLHEDVCALAPRPGPQPKGAVQDGYVTALLTDTPHAPQWIWLLGVVGFLLWVHKNLRPLIARRPKLPPAPTDLSGGRFQDPASLAAASVWTHSTLFPSWSCPGHHRLDRHLPWVKDSQWMFCSSEKSVCFLVASLEAQC